MSDRYIEKAFIYLLVISVALHIGVFALIFFLPNEQQPPPKEPVFHRSAADAGAQTSGGAAATGDKTLLRATAACSQGDGSPRRCRPQQFRAATPAGSKAAAPGDRTANSIIQAVPIVALETPGIPSDSRFIGLQPAQTQVPGAPQIAQPQLFPGAQRLARLEEGYRRKFENDVAEGDTRFLNSDDIQFGSFLRRFEDRRVRRLALSPGSGPEGDRGHYPGPDHL